MKGEKETCNRQAKIEKKHILDMLKENDCETLEELKNLINFLNSENKRLHSMNVENLKRINILGVRVKTLESITKGYDQYCENRKSYKCKLKELTNKVNELMIYAKDKEVEYSKMAKEHEIYFKNLYLNLNKIIESIIPSNDGSTSPRESSIENNEKVFSCDTTKNNEPPSSSRSATCASDASYGKIDDRDGRGMEEEPDYHTKRETQDEAELPSKLFSTVHNLFMNKSGKKEEGERCNKKIEKIKSLRSSYKNVDNEVLSSGNSNFEKENDFAINSKHKTAIGNFPKSSFYAQIGKKENAINFEDENEESTDLYENTLSTDEKIKNQKKLNKLETQKKVNKIVDYNADIKKRLNNLLDDIGKVENHKKRNTTVRKNNLNKGINSKSNIIDILNNKVNITSLERIESSTPKYVKYNTIHREIMNPRQHFSNQNKSSIDHIICL
ncbi:conserved Plasmodium protein, unknown function [Plasmodium ovale]|uniref:Uncharacterized protein n=1 Tax=Plasmodium ovale TaxID=36330 RepID=A0A1C3KSY4_PLAOA|nr:conserved Plasmodium protein, unknown function [Plasmodium ovale]